MSKRSLTGVAVLALVLALAAPASADPPERFEDAIFSTAADVEHGLAVFVNITRDDLCEWVAGGADGPPPVDRLVPVQITRTGQGALVRSYRSEATVELYRVDDDVPPFENPCDDTDAQAGPWATGTGSFWGTDNDLAASGTRANSFGGTLQARVHAVDGGTWRYTSTARLQNTRDGEFHVRAESVTLTRVGRP